MDPGAAVALPPSCEADLRMKPIPKKSSSSTQWSDSIPRFPDIRYELLNFPLNWDSIIHMPRGLENIVPSLSSGPSGPCVLHSALLSLEQGSASGQPPVFVNRFIATHPQALTYVLSMTAFTLYHQKKIVMIVATESTKPKIVTTWPFTDKQC